MSGQRMIIMNAGSSYFEHVENYYGSNACEQNSCRNAEMPEELKTEKAQRIKNNLIEIGVVTEDFMPLGLSIIRSCRPCLPDWYRVGNQEYMERIRQLLGS